MDWECPECGRGSKSYKSYSAHYRQSHGGHGLVAYYGEDRIRELYQTHSENELADRLGVTRPAAKAALKHIGVDRRGRSEAESFKWSQMSEDERKRQVEAAHETLRERYQNGNGTLQEWYRDDPERAIEHARQVGALGAAARERNGMDGVTGQDHPRWNGGKSIYDAVKKCIRGESWTATRERVREEAGRRCEACGKRQPNRGLDVHHIIPVMNGGTNADDLLMSLCIQCHGQAEAYTWSIPEVTPVLTE